MDDGQLAVRVPVADEAVSDIGLLQWGRAVLLLVERSFFGEPRSLLRGGDRDGSAVPAQQGHRVSRSEAGEPAARRGRSHKDNGFRPVEGERGGPGAAQPVRDAGVPGSRDHNEEGGRWERE